MRYSLLLTLLAFSSATWSDDGRRACPELAVVVKNNTQATCYLLSTDIRSGAYASGQKQPVNKITPGDTHSFIFEQSNYYGTDVVLSYECGNGEVTFRSHKDPCLQQGAITGTLLAASNMNATYDVSLGNYWSQIRGNIYWTLSDIAN